MKLYEMATTPSCRRVNIFLKLLGVEPERVTVDVRSGENLSSHYRNISANLKVPLLEIDDDTHLCESVAICRYVDAITPNQLYLFGRSPLEMAQVEMWQRMVELQGLMPAFQAFRNLSGVYRDRETCIELWGEESKKRVAAFLPVLEQQLAKHRYVAGSDLTIADISAFVFIKVCENALQLPVIGHYPNISAWLQELQQHDGFSA
ncbi:glutathione S-transferase family protein [Shewanella sp. YIC-542]|uniref:glutathione S-transferase family protein n=1 Tax=Shewanella mytili TaxID=3377111 RepID=UPI00398E3D6C